MAKRKPLREVTEPAAVIPQNKHCTISLYVVPSGDGFRLPDQDGKEQWASGPVVVVKKTKGDNHEFEFYDIDAPELWKWLGGLLAAGWWSLTDARTARLIPDHLAGFSPRFAGKTPEQRQKISDAVRRKRRTPAVKKSKPTSKKSEPTSTKG